MKFDEWLHSADCPPSSNVEVLMRAAWDARGEADAEIAEEYRKGYFSQHADCHSIARAIRALDSTPTPLAPPVEQAAPTALPAPTHASETP